MGWPPKFGVVGRDSSLQAKGRRLDSPRARLKLGPDFQRVALLETEPRFPALRRGNWGPISRKIVESCGVPSNFSMRDTFLLGREIFRANIIGNELLDSTFMQILQHILALFFSTGNVEETLPKVKHSSTSKVNFPQGKPEQIQDCQTHQKQK